MNEQLSDKEQIFIETLLENDGDFRTAAEIAGYAPAYGYALRKKLSPFIVEAAREYLGVHSVRAANKLINSLDEEIPSAARITAAAQILDRVGISKKDLNDDVKAIKASIFILPAKEAE
jgi:hypothetical protein